VPLSVVDNLFLAEGLREPDDLCRVVYAPEEGDTSEKQRREGAVEAPDSRGGLYGVRLKGSSGLL
jgi:hypothetical protein